VNEFWHALGDVIREGGFLSVVIGALLLGGIGGIVERVFSGRGKAAVAKAQLKSARAENARLTDLLRHLGDNQRLELTAQGGDVAQLAAQARVALSDRAELLSIVDRVQGADQAYPQLPQELRDAIDAALSRQRGSTFIEEVKSVTERPTW
jgi:hypothetical protein